MYTSCYNNFKTDKYKHCSICLDKGEDANYKGECFEALAPCYYFFRKYKDNIGKIPKEENVKYYIREYWKNVLSKLDPYEVYVRLSNYTLLCYEDNNEFCHRHIIAAWISLFLNIEVPEVKIENDEIKIIDRPLYIRDYLEEIIQEKTKLWGYNSIRAFYLHTQALKFKIDKMLNNEIISDIEFYVNMYNQLDREVQDIEADYNKKLTLKK